MQLGVHSEIGKLRKVMVSRPSLAHQRLTPGNCHDLLFDDVIWVQKARSDHADFVLKMKDRGIEVFDIQDLLTDIFRDSPEARAFVLDRRITDNQVGPGLRRVIRPWLDEIDPHLLARHMLGGVVLEDMPADLVTPLVREALSAKEFIVKPVPNALFQRDPSCWIYGGVTCNPMFWPARKPESLFQRAVYKFHPAFTKNEFEIWWGDSDEDWGNTSMEGGDVMPIGKGVVLIGMGERTTRQAVNQVADRLFDKGAAERVIACAMPKSRAAMHLDTVFTCLDHDKVTAFREVVLVEYPRLGLWSLGFVTAPAVGLIPGRPDEEGVYVFLPTTPNPTSGYTIVVPRGEAHRAGITVEEGLKVILSGGFIAPPGRSDDRRRAARESA